MNNISEKEKIISVKDFAKLAKISDTTVYNWIRSSHLKSVTRKRGVRNFVGIPYSEFIRIYKT